MNNTVSYLLFLSFLLVLYPSRYNSFVLSLRFDYNFSSPGVLAGVNLTYVGDASPLGDRISLTKSSKWSSGFVAHEWPLRLWDNTTSDHLLQIASFTTNFTIAINLINNNTNQGDGMAFFIRPYPAATMPPDSPGGFLALFSNPDGRSNTGSAPAVGVEFDSYENHMWDPKGAGAHIGIDVNSVTSTAYVPAPAPGIRGTVSASVRYDAGSGTLDVAVRFDDLPAAPSRNVTARVDLRESGFPPEVAVGFSAATGDYLELHELLAWSFDSVLSSKQGVATSGKTPPVVVIVVLIRKKRKNHKKSAPVSDVTVHPLFFANVTSQEKPRMIVIIAGVATAGAFLLLCLVSFYSYQKRFRRKCNTNSQEEEQINCDELMDEEFEKGTGPRRFSYSELSQATFGFSDDHKLGEGGFGSVYRGFLQGQRLHVAVKRVSKTSRQGRREYISEVTVISRLRHRSLVQLVGWCHDADELLLVYELMANGSLDTHLYSSKNILSWTIRYNAILSMGSALLYMHQECEKCVLHRDIKPSNVMLDASFNAKLGDFGLSRLIDHSRGQHTTALAGTLGYMDPESTVTSRASTDTDMYSFGVLLLEVACGRRPIDPEEEESKVRLIDWVWRLYGSSRLLDAADQRLSAEFEGQEMERAMVVGLWCVHPDYGFRPSVRQAMSVLQFDAPLPDLPPEMPTPLYYAQQQAGGYRSGCTSSVRSSGEGGR
ncbi:hypothetical protein EJB05_44897, partial [Eragrostis curvula]